jgi:adenine-specific DNA-methyltransferase
MTELTWEGKYDDKGRRVAPPRIALPFQTVETVNESAADRDRMQDLFASGRPTDWRNRLIWGDKKYVLPSLLEEFAGKVDLIYIDPPFATGGDFSFIATVPDDPDTDGDQGTTFTKEPSVIEQKAYRDTWGKGLDSYLKWFSDTATLLRELLTQTGSIYVHLDYNVGHYAKVVMDEVFGAESFVNSITWKRSDAHSDVGQGARHLGRISDVILYYTRSADAQTLNMQFSPLSQQTADRWYRHIDPATGRRYNKADTSGPGGATKGNPVFEWNGIRRAWRFSKQRMQELHDAGLLVYSESGIAYIKRYLDESKGVPLQDIWDDIKMIRGIHSNSEGLGYATQKPEALLERIIKTSSNEGDLVLDCFCGSGTTAVVAEKLNRRWIGCDLGRFAIHTARKRLLGIPGVKPFIVQNLGKYERQAWQVAEFGESAEAATAAYRRFVLELYHAQPVAGYVWLHGSKSGRMVHVGGVDAPVTRADVTGIVTEFRKAVGTGKDAPTRSGIDALGWDFAFELNETARQEAELAGINLRLIRIPRELLEKKAVEQGDIKFFELAALSVAVKKKARVVTLELTDFIIPLDDVPEDIQKAVTHWEQWIDYWAVDWNNSDDTFHNEWQSYRTRKDPALARQTTHTYDQPGKYRVVVKVIDILGNDTTKLLQVEVK